MVDTVEILNMNFKPGLIIKPNKEYDFYIDRRTVIGNPYLIGRDGNRDEVCDLYNKWFQDNINSKKIKNYLEIIILAYIKYGKVRLFCWCYPKRCHGNTIKKYLMEEINGN